MGLSQQSQRFQPYTVCVRQFWKDVPWILIMKSSPSKGRVAALEKECMELDAGLRWALEELRKKKILPPAILSICP
jgi:hypothetical protein